MKGVKLGGMYGTNQGGHSRQDSSATTMMQSVQTTELTHRNIPFDEDDFTAEQKKSLFNDNLKLDIDVS
jgi:hypothetical protein